MLILVQKKLFLTELLKCRAVLQQRFEWASDGKKRKDEVWKAIHDVLLCNGFTGSIEQLRDQEYQNMWRATMRKIERNALRSGAGNPGGEKLTEIDKLLLSYIRKDSPTVNAISCAESSCGTAKVCT